MNMRIFSTRILLMMICAVLLAGTKQTDAEAKAAISDELDALLKTDNATTFTAEETDTVYAAKKVTKKVTKKSKKNTKSFKEEKDTKTTDKDKSTKSSDDKKTDKSSKKEDSKKDSKNNKDAKNNKKSDSTDTEKETADDTESPTHYTVHTATGAKRLADEYQDYTYEMCEKYGIADYYDLILIQMCCESSYNLHAVGASRYYGLMQISSASFSRLQAALGLTDIREPHQNIEAGVYLMSCLIQKYGDAQMALVCYHRGESAARRGIRSDSYSAKIVAMQATLEEA